MKNMNKLSKRLNLKVEAKKNQKLIKKEWVRELTEVVVNRLEIKLLKH